MRELHTSLRHFRAFIMVGRLQNVRRTADAICLTQPAVSLAISKFEEDVGAQLFDRRNYGIFLTDAGKILAARVERMFSQIVGALEAVGATTNGSESYEALGSRITRAHIRALSMLIGSEGDNGSEAVSRTTALRSVRDMENVLGVEFLLHDADGYSINKTGRRFSERLDVALLEIINGLDEIDAEAGRRRGTIRVGAMPLSGSFILTHVLADITARSSKVNFEVSSGDYAKLIEGLRRAETDVIIGAVAETSHAGDLSCVRLASFPFVLVTRAGHPMAGRTAPLTNDELASLFWVTPKPGTTRRHAYDNLIKGLARSPAETIQASSYSSLQILLADGNRVGLLTRFEYEQSREISDLVVLPCRQIRPMVDIGLTCRTNWAPTALQREFTDLVHDYGRKIAMQMGAALPQDDTDHNEIAP